ncbi:MAG TPA: response regulator [Polyangiaceae bacterium]|nr:response regulator [Polyangiaceae bacterium]
MEQIFLLPGDSVTTRKPTHLATLLGSCVSVCLTNIVQRTAGMNHYMLPEATAGADPGRYGDTSIRQLVKTLFALDSDPRHYRARVYGGGKVIGHLGALGDIGSRNIEIARHLLGELGIGVAHEEVGGSKGRRIDFNTETDVIECRVVGTAGVTSTANAPAAANARVLIVDDSPVLRRLLRMGLDGCDGISVVGEASNAFEARDQVLSLDPDVLTLDIEMPEIDGVTFLRQLMKHMPKPVIVMSSLSTPGSQMEARAKAAGAFEVLDKGRLSPTQGLDGVRSVLAPVLRRAASRARAAK